MFVWLYKTLKAIALVGDILKTGEVKAPLLVSKSGVVLDGRTRLRIAKRMGYKTVPVVRIEADVEQVDPRSLTAPY